MKITTPAPIAASAVQSIQFMRLGASSPVARVRRMVPSGPSSNAQVSSKVSGRPTANSIRVATDSHLGSSKVSNTVLATWNMPHAVTV